VSPRRTALAATALSLIFAAPAAACEGADIRPSAGTVAEAREATVCLINEERTKRGLKPLEVDSRLQKAAKRHSDDMRKRRYFDHVSPAGRTDVHRAKAAGYGRFRSLGENLAWGTGVLATPRSIVRSWMGSAGHRRNILDPGFRDVGVGIALGAPVRGYSGGATYTADFGSI
jgi:uncharacterized protein YkwD